VTRAQADRRLMAIVSTDVAGCTAFTERDEGAAIRVRERHRALIRTPASQFEGELGLMSSMTPVEDLAPQIGAPTLVIHGDRDAAAPRRFRDPARVADPRREARDLASSQPRGGTVEDSRLIKIVIGFVSEPETAQ